MANHFQVEAQAISSQPNAFAIEAARRREEEERRNREKSRKLFEAEAKEAKAKTDIDIRDVIDDLEPESLFSSAVQGVKDAPGALLQFAKDVGTGIVTPPEGGILKSFGDVPGKRFIDLGKRIIGGVTGGIVEPSGPPATEAEAARETLGNIIGFVPAFKAIRGGLGIGAKTLSGLLGTSKAAKVVSKVLQASPLKSAAAGGIIGGAKPLSEGDLPSAVRAGATGATLLGALDVILPRLTRGKTKFEKEARLSKESRDLRTPEELVREAQTTLELKEAIKKPSGTEAPVPTIRSRTGEGVDIRPETTEGVSLRSKETPILRPEPVQPPLKPTPGDLQAKFPPRKIEGVTPLEAELKTPSKFRGVDPEIIETVGKIVGESVIEKPLPSNTQIFRNIADGFKSEVLDVATTRKIAAGTIKSFNREGIKLDPNIPTTIQIARAIAENKLDIGKFIKDQEGSGVAPEQIGDAFISGLSTSGKLMNAASQIQKALTEVTKDVPGAEAILKRMSKAKLPPSFVDFANHFRRRASGIWKGLLVSRVETAVRNAEIQGIRLGIQSLERAVDNGLRKSFKLPGAEPFPETFRGFIDLAESMTKKGRKNLDKILESFPEQNEALFFRWSSDIQSKFKLPEGKIPKSVVALDSLFNKAQRGVEILNVLNRGQEFFSRRAASRAFLADRLRRKGVDINTVDAKTIDIKDIVDSVEHGLELTFASNPRTGFSGAFLELYKNPVIGPLLDVGLPFGRFMLNSWKFFYEFSPAGALKLLSKNERAKIAKGDTKVLSRAIIGTGLLGTALAIRLSEFAGDKYYEVGGKPDKEGNRTIVDSRPFNPLVSYLFVADLIIKFARGQLRPEDLTSKEFLQGLFSANFRGAAGGFLLDGIIDIIQSVGGDTGGSSQANQAKRFTAETLAGLLTPLGNISSILSDQRFMSLFGLEKFAKAEGSIRDVRESPFIDPLLNKIPIARQSLPESEFVLGTGDTSKKESLFKAGTGISLRKKTPAQQEADRLKIRSSDLLRASGIPELDREIAKKARSLAELMLGKLISNPRYKNIKDDDLRTILFKETLQEVTKLARKEVFEERPDLELKNSFNKLSRFKKRLLRKKFEAAGVELP